MNHRGSPQLESDVWMALFFADLTGDGGIYKEKLDRFR